MIAYLQKSEGSEGFHQIIDFLTASHIKYALTENLIIYVSLIEQFWQTTIVSTLEDGDMGITATIDRKVKVVYDASIRRHLKDIFPLSGKIDEDEGITLVQKGAQTQGRSDEDLMYETGVYDYPKGFTGPSVSITTTKLVTTALEGVSTTRAIPKEVSTAKPDMDVTLAEALVDLLKSGNKKSLKPKARDKGKAIMTEPKKQSKKKDQIQIDEELALRLHAKEQAKFKRLQKERDA
ncbi:hypothetical protein Tco_1263647 [Tanacetum coccineum]